MLLAVDYFFVNFICFSQCLCTVTAESLPVLPRAQVSMILDSRPQFSCIFFVFFPSRNLSLCLYLWKYCLAELWYAGQSCMFCRIIQIVTPIERDISTFISFELLLYHNIAHVCNCHCILSTYSALLSMYCSLWG